MLQLESESDCSEDDEVERYERILNGYDLELFCLSYILRSCYDLDDMPGSIFLSLPNSIVSASVVVVY